MSLSSKRSSDLLDIIRSRRSIRRFQKKPVSRDLIKKIVEAGLWAPSTCNQQLWNFTVVDDQKIKQRLIDEAASTTLIGRAPAIIIVSYEKSNFREALQSAQGAVQNILLAANYFGVSATCLNSFGNEDKIKEILEIGNDQLIITFVALGYRDATYEADTDAPSRRPIENVIHFNKYSDKNKYIFTYDPSNWSLKQLQNYQRYYCRKTFLGKEMDIMHPYEKEIVKIALKDCKSPILDLLSYDGCYLPLYPDAKITAMDLTDETSKYTKEAVRLLKDKKLNIRYVEYDTTYKKVKAEKFKTITAIYKFERLSIELKDEFIKDAYKMLDKDGEFVIVFRTPNIIYRVFYNLIIFKFKNDVRNTGIYTFFGPYKPMNSNNFIATLKDHGFKSIDKKKYFAFPPFFDQAYQMYLQFKKSKGSSYLHRLRRENFITKIIGSILKAQGFRAGIFGSVCVVRAKKDE